MSRIATRILSLVLVPALFLSGCATSKIRFNYPSERMVYPQIGQETPRLFVDLVNDLRPDSQRSGRGGQSTSRFPSDENWEAPVNQIYYQALVQDLSQTGIVELVPLRSQADYILEIDLEHMGCRLTRSPLSWFMSALFGAGVTYLISPSWGSLAVGAVLGIGAVPAATQIRAVSQVKLRVYDQDQILFFEQTCLGEITKNTWEGLTARKQQEWVDTYLSVAVKRCNACLLGQLRQAFVDASESP